MAGVGIYQLISLLLIQGGAVCGKLFFSQSEYQLKVPMTHPQEQPLVSMRLYNTSLREQTQAVCHMEHRDRALFTLSVNGSQVLLYHSQPLTSGPEQEQYSLSVSCGDSIEDTSATTTVLLSALSENKSRQVPDINEICFSGFPDHVSVRENSTGLVVTEFVGCQLIGCEQFTRGYSIKPQQDKWKGYFSIDLAGRLWVNKALDYEGVKEVKLTVGCNVTGPATGRQDVQRRNVTLDVVNINDIPPTINGTHHLDKEITDLSTIKSGDLLDILNIFDDDGLEEGVAFIRGDDIRQFNVTTRVSTLGGTQMLRLWVHWAQNPVITNVTYKFEVVYQDKGYNDNYGQSASQEKVYIVKLDIWHNWTVRDTAQNYSRVKHDLPVGEGYSDYSMLDVRGVPGDTFSITPNTGILYVSNSHHLTHAANRPVTIQFQYKNGDKIIPTKVKTITISRTRDGNTTHDRQCDKPCSYQRTQAACTTSCGVGVGAPNNMCSWTSHCMFRAHLPSNVCTCSQHRDTCTDNKCDELEELYPSLCPFDCPAGRNATELYQKEKGNIGNAHCWCEEDKCYCRDERDDTDKKLQEARQAGIPKQTAPSCGLWCITLAVGGSLVVSFVVMVIALFARHSYRRQQDKATPEKPLNGSVASLSATPSDYVVDTGDQQTRMSAAASQNSLDWLTRGLGAPLAIDKKWEFPRKNLTLEKTLGEGEFGRVVSAQAYELNTVNEYTTVAIKMLKECATGSELRDLLSEYNLLKDVSHTNVIKLLGVCSKGGPFYLIVEYCEHGALRSYLRDCRLHEPYTDPRSLPLAHPTTNSSTQEADPDNPLPDHNITANDLLSFAWQITKGMQYLSAMKLVHRDLAARNVLVASGKVIKISDFGLSRDIYEEDTYMKRSKGRIPVKWMAPESLYEQVYTTKSDVWSFGITLWEIVTLGATPYPGLGPERLYHRLKSGYRMEKPAHCSDQLFRVMSWCWRTLPGDRPTFTQLVDTMEVMLKQNVEYLDLGGALDRHPILDDDTMDTDDAVSDKEGGYGSISRLTEDNAYLNPASHAQHNFDDVVCDDCTMRMIKEGDVTTECTKLLGGNQGETDCVNNNSNSTKANTRPPLLYIQVEHDNSDEEGDGQVVIPVL